MNIKINNMKNKELLNNIIAITSACNVIKETKYTYDDVVRISEEYAKQQCITQRKDCSENPLIKQFL